MQESMTALAAHQTVQEAAHKADAKVRTVEKIEIDQAVRQGDIYITRVSSVPSNTISVSDRQLAPGTTQGSRHIVAGDVRLRALTGEVSPLQGPFISSEKAFTIEHPEHGHICLPAGDYSCTYQRDYSAEELARVRD